MGRARKREKELGGPCDSEREAGCVSGVAQWRCGAVLLPATRDEMIEFRRVERSVR